MASRNAPAHALCRWRIPVGMVLDAGVVAA
jgi:hypothetical protein